MGRKDYGAQPPGKGIPIRMFTGSGEFEDEYFPYALTRKVKQRQHMYSAPGKMPARRKFIPITMTMTMQSDCSPPLPARRNPDDERDTTADTGNDPVNHLNYG